MSTIGDLFQQARTAVGEVVTLLESFDVPLQGQQLADFEEQMDIIDARVNSLLDPANLGSTAAAKPPLSDQLDADPVLAAQQIDDALETGLKAHNESPPDDAEARRQVDWVDDKRAEFRAMCDGSGT